MTDFWIFTFIS